MEGAHQPAWLEHQVLQSQCLGLGGGGRKGRCLVDGSRTAGTQVLGRCDNSAVDHCICLTTSCPAPPTSASTPIPLAAPAQGLGTSTAAEAKQYFANIQSHRKEFVWDGERAACG